MKVPEAEHVPIEAIDLQPDLRYQEIPVKIWTQSQEGQEILKYGFAEFSGADTELRKLRGNAKTR